MHNETTFRYWVSDDTCIEGSASIQEYKGTNTQDDFGFWDCDELDADLEVLWEVSEGAAPKLIDMIEVYRNPKLYRALKDAAVDSHLCPSGTPVEIPGSNRTDALPF